MGGTAAANDPGTSLAPTVQLAQTQLAMELAGIGLWRHDFLTQRIHYNPQSWRVLGLPPRDEALSLDEVRALIHPDDLPAVQAAAQRALSTDGPTDMEARYRHSDGSWRYVMTRRVLQRNEAGEPVAFLGVGMDVTERVEAQRRSAAWSGRFEQISELAGIGHWSAREGDERAVWSPRMRELFGLSAGEAVPTTAHWLQHLVHPDDRERVRRGLIDWLRSDTADATSDFRIVRRDGQVRQLLARSRLETDADGRMRFGVCIDVTETRSAEQALRSARERVALAARGVGLGTWEIDLVADQTFWDEAMFALRGVPPRPDAPKLMQRLAFVHPDDRAAMARANERALVRHEPADLEFRVVWPDGQVRWLASRAVTLFDTGGRPLRRIGVNWDITDSHNAAAARQDIELAQRESQAKSRFLSRMSHELRTPLNAVLGFTQLMQAAERSSDAGSTQRREQLAHVAHAGQHLLALINDVLDLAALEGGEVRVTPEPVALAPLVAQTLPLLEPLPQQHGVTLHSSVPALTVLADPVRLRQALLNLLSNAIKYNRRGGRVDITAESADGEVRLQVADTGPGLTPEQQRQLFEPFNRLGAERLGIAGTGIGLSIVKTLMQRMHGSVQVLRSAPGQGCVFELRLPQLSPRSSPVTDTEPPSPQAATPPPRHQLLYVEDNAVNALIMQELVAFHGGLDLHLATDGAQGLALARELQPDLLLLDMQLPDMDGHEVLRRLRADPATAGIRCIALSANAMPEYIRRAMAAGLNGYWTKPLNFETFRQAMRDLFGDPPQAG